jgi:glycosyltransferase involved in cell wall biosynthesis
MEVGGTQRQIVHLAQGLDRRRFAPEVLYFRNRSDLVDELEASGVSVTQVPRSGRLDPVFLLRLVRLCRARRPDIVHCFAFAGELWGAVASMLSGQGRLITSVRGTYEWYSPAEWRVKRWTASRSFRLVANSRAGAAYAEPRLGLAPGSIHVVYNGVSLPGLGLRASSSSLRRELGLAVDDVVALFVGRLVDHKDLPTLIEAMSRLAQSMPSLLLLVAGDGPLREPIEARIAARRLGERVRMLGLRRDVGELMAAADFIVLPSVREGMSNVLLEAMAGTRPVVASRVGGNPEIVEDGVTGLLFRAGDATALATQMRRLALDPSLREQLGRAGRTRVEQAFSMESTVREMEQVYEECLAESGAR